ncbi:MAG: hypothetical protein C0631_02880 [Sedimenticola sp.]|nr:MAG: hypothetical protein C0631_02880 [Sedimenticola sp.]
MIDDGEHVIRAFAWQGQYQGLNHLKHNVTVYLTGSWRQKGNNSYLNCETIIPSDALPVAVSKAQNRVRAMIASIKSDTLSQFLLRVFSDQALLEKFMTLPASRNHHHSYVNGLFIHSVDTAWRAFEFTHLKTDEKDVAMVASLLHDIGKIKTLADHDSRTYSGKCIRHEDITLEVLAEHLKWLDSVDPLTCDKLRYCLTWNHQKERIPKHMLAEYIKFADHASTASEVPRNQWYACHFPALTQFV